MELKRLWIIGMLLACSAQSADRLNVLFITVDDMNCDSVGAFGCKVDNVTPNIDRLASQGLRFINGHVTIAICMPTRAVWMTGRYPHRSGALGFDRIKPNVPTLLEAVHKAGWQTGIMAKVPHVVPSRGAAWDVVVKATQLGVGRNPKMYHQHAAKFFKTTKATGKPFFLMANMQDPHRPFAGSPQEAARKKRKNRQSKFPGVSRAYKPGEIVVPKFLPDIPEVRRELAEYFTSVHRADECVGAVLRALDEAGLADNTLVMFLSDHGMPLPFAKTNCWRESTQTPWIVRWPGVTAPEAVDRQHFVAGIDLAPTILDALGLKPLAGMDGKSFLPVLKGAEQKDRGHVFTHINRTAGKREYPMRAVQDARFGYIFNAWSDGKTIFRNESQNGRTMKAMAAAAKNNPAIAVRVKHFLYRSKEELYDHANDPAALHNLAADPKHRKTLSRYRAIMMAHLKATKDPVLPAFEAHLGAGR